MATVPGASDEDLARLFGADVAEALRQYAKNNGGTIGLPPEPWTGGGRSGSLLGAVILRMPSVSYKLIVKVLGRGRHSHEPAAHERAWQVSPAWSAKHMVRQFGQPYPVGDGRFLMFFEVKGSLSNLRPLARVHPDHLARACGEAARLLLVEWPPSQSEGAPTKPMTVSDYLTTEVRGAFDDGENAHRWAAAARLLDEAAQLIGIGEGETHRMVLNPLTLVRGPLCAEMKIEYVWGPAHGDNHLGNSLVECDPDGVPNLARILFVDWPAYEPSAPRTRDLAALVLSIAARDLRDTLPDDQAEALAKLILDPLGGCPAVLTRVTGEAIRSVYEPTYELFPGWEDERRAQYLLSVLAEALRYTGYGNIGEPGRMWFFELAGRAGAAFLADRGRSSATVVRPEVVLPPAEGSVEDDRLEMPERPPEVTTAVPTLPAPASTNSEGVDDEDSEKRDEVDDEDSKKREGAADEDDTEPMPVQILAGRWSRRWARRLMVAGSVAAAALAWWFLADHRPFGMVPGHVWSLSGADLIDRQPVEAGAARYENVSLELPAPPNERDEIYVDFDRLDVGEANVAPADEDAYYRRSQRASRTLNTLRLRSSSQATVVGQSRPDGPRCVQAIRQTEADDRVDLVPGRQLCLVTGSGLVTAISVEEVSSAGAVTLLASAWELVWPPS